MRTKQTGYEFTRVKSCGGGECGITENWQVQ